MLFVWITKQCRGIIIKERAVTGSLVPSMRIYSHDGGVPAFVHHTVLDLLFTCITQVCSQRAQPPPKKYIYEKFYIPNPTPGRNFKLLGPPPPHKWALPTPMSHILSIENQARAVTLHRGHYSLLQMVVAILENTITSRKRLKDIPEPLIDPKMSVLETSWAWAVLLISPRDVFPKGIFP